MKILHIAPNAPYTEGFGYQENLLTKYQVRNGHEVVLLITTNKQASDGKFIRVGEEDYVSPSGYRVLRRDFKKILSRKFTWLFCRFPVMDLLNDLNPDVVFFHGFMSATIIDVVRYKKKHRNCKVVMDSHSDYSNCKNSGKEIDFKGKLFRQYYRILNRYSCRYIDRIYGVTPWCGQFLEEYVNIPKDRISLLAMGADDEKIHFDQMPELRDKIRKDLSISPDDFVIVSGGKIEKSKNFDLLVQAISELGNDKIKLILFGRPNKEMAGTIYKLIKDSTNFVRYIGWIDSDKVYDYYLASDLAVFPGGQSVLWGQACGSGIPCVFKHWDNITYLDKGGNCLFLDVCDKSEIASVINELYNDKEKYEVMKRAAVEFCIPAFSYRNIAKRSIDF